MNAAYAYTRAIWPPLVATCLLVALSLGSWRRRDVPGAGPLAAGSLFAALWLLAVALGAAAVAATTRIAWQKVQVALQLSLVTATTCFALEYVHPGRWLTRRNLALLALPPVVALLLILVRDGQLFWRRLELGPDGTVVGHLATAGAILLAYGLGLVLVNMVALVWLFVRSPQHRWPAALILLGGIAGRALYLLNFAGASLPGQLDPDVIALVFGWAMYAAAVFGFRLFDPLPAARRAVLEQIRDGVVVCDTQWRVVSLNPAAEAIVGAPAAHAHGRPASELLVGFSGLPPLAARGDAGAIEISRGQGAKTRHYVLDHQPLVDFRGQTVGCLMLLRDVTERRQAEAQALQQQWAQATIEERELLAQELHDSLSQSLGFLNLQAQAAELYAQGGQDEAALASLTRLAAVSRDLQGDVRALIGDLLSVSLPTEGFCSALRQVVMRFEEQTGQAVTLEMVGEADVACDGSALPPAAGVQLLRIVQEALANVRKHAERPSQVNVRLAADDGQLRLAIADNGAGFDPARPPPVGEHYGLQVMRQRAQRIGGEVTVESAPGQGTRVEVSAPLRSSRGRPTG